MSLDLDLSLDTIIAWKRKPHAMVGATSVNAANLRANLWTELARWYAAPRAAILRANFTMTKTEIFAKDHPQTWRLETRAWAQDANAEQIGNALAGLHAKYVMWLLDATIEIERRFAALEQRDKKQKNDEPA
jgi:hypothetical protein